MSFPARYFRAGVGAVIVNRSGRVLALEREQIPGAWQLPQGGWEADETAEAGAFREVEEETGLLRDQLELVDRYPEPLVYELPAEWQTAKTGLGQVQYWYLLKLRGEESELTLPREGEFRAWRWMPMSRLIAETSPFRRALYRRLQAEFRL
ncbi:MAG: RNA pyrophosphohydrolase [Verrucomicrobia bacterium]|nr:RNA pyrophosphohydrolase [Verrucomicrobiota bacterium]